MATPAAEWTIATRRGWPGAACGAGAFPVVLDCATCATTLRLTNKVYYKHGLNEMILKKPHEISDEPDETIDKLYEIICEPCENIDKPNGSTDKPYGAIDGHMKSQINKSELIDKPQRIMKNQMK